MRNCLVLAAVIALLCMTTAAQADADYPAGFTWNSLADWTVRPDTDEGTTRGNPAPDSVGTSVWSYEYLNSVQGTWYKNQTSEMIWQNHWFGSYGYWVRSINSLPNATYNGVTCTAVDVPVVRWINPTQAAQTVQVNLLTPGSETVVCGDADLVVCLDHGTGANGIELLFSRSFGGWTSFVGDVGTVVVRPGDSIFYAAMKHGDSWTCSYTPLNIVAVPEPSSLLALTTGPAAMLFFLRKRR